MHARWTPAGRLLLPVLLLLVLLGAASPAAAHTRLTGSSPAAGAEVPAGTSEVVLSFAGSVREAFSTVVVTGPDGTDAASGPAVLRGTDVVQELARPLAPGDWTVAYRVVAGDGHPIAGTFGVTVTAVPVAGASAPVPSPLPDQAPLDLAGASGQQDGSLLLPTAAALVVAAGAGALVLRRRSPRSGRA